MKTTLCNPWYRVILASAAVGSVSAFINSRCRIMYSCHFLPFRRLGHWLLYTFHPSLNPTDERNIVVSQILYAWSAMTTMGCTRRDVFLCANST
ncbi:hypothetical protein BKA83DRAFT_2658157 [Pisolithus microcarpus]|nr:hypothetical protein BKA83DRAFT_2658157 [Pisolithus microcarpus]